MVENVTENVPAKKKFPAFATLTIIALVAAVLLGAANLITKGPIEDGARAAADAARAVVLPEAEVFVEQRLPAVAGATGTLNAVHAGLRGDEAVGYTAVATTQGSQGPVEVVLGLDLEGRITGVSVGGSKFAETSGLGTKAQEPAFTDQFIGQSAPLALGQQIDAISGATVTSRAVVAAANLAADGVAAAVAAGITTTVAAESHGE